MTTNYAVSPKPTRGYATQRQSRITVYSSVKLHQEVHSFLHEEPDRWARREEAEHVLHDLETSGTDRVSEGLPSTPLQTYFREQQFIYLKQVSLVSLLLAVAGSLAVNVGLGYGALLLGTSLVLWGGASLVSTAAVGSGYSDPRFCVLLVIAGVGGWIVAGVAAFS